MKLIGWQAPESLYHHQRDLWQLVRRLIFSDGRLARIGGDTRVRFAYCQEYLLPALLFGGDHCGDAHAGFLVEQQLELIRREDFYLDDDLRECGCKLGGYFLSGGLLGVVVLTIAYWSFLRAAPVRAPAGPLGGGLQAR